MSPTTTTNIETFSWDGPFGLPVAIVTAILLLALFAWSLRREQGVLGGRNTVLFWVLRGIALAVVVWMLLAPAKQRVEVSTTRRSVAIVTDVSGSMRTVDPEGTSDDLRWTVTTLDDPRFVRTKAADQAVAAAGIAELHLHRAAEALEQHQGELVIAQMTSATDAAVQRTRENLQIIVDDPSTAQTLADSLPGRILKSLNGPEFEAFAALTKALRKGRTPSQKGWRESLPDLEHRIGAIRRKLVELARQVARQEAQAIARQQPELLAETRQASRLTRAADFVDELHRNVLASIQEKADVHHSSFDQSLTLLSHQNSPAQELRRFLPTDADTKEVVSPGSTDLSSVLEERWTTIANFATSAHQPKTETEKAMLQQVSSEAVAMGALVRPGHVVRPGAVRPALAAFACATAVLIGFMAISWPQTSVLLQRFWSPNSAITATQLKSATGDVTIPRGQTLEIVTLMTGLRRAQASVFIEPDSGLNERIELQPNEADTSTFVCEWDVDESFRYRVESGDGRTGWYTVTAVDHPDFAELRLTITPPEYVARDAFLKTLIPGRIKAIQGSQFLLEMKPTHDLAKLELRLTRSVETDSEDGTAGNVEDLLPLTADSDGWYRFQTQLLEDLSLSPSLLNEHGLTNDDPQVCRIIVIPDAAPVARVILPTDEMAVTADDVIEIKFEAHDDHGVAMAELVIYDESAAMDGEPPPILSIQQIPLGEQTMQKHVMATTKLDLKELGLEEGTDISYAVRVTDNRMLNLDPETVREMQRDAERETTMESSRVAQFEQKNKDADRDREEDSSSGKARESSKDSQNEATDLKNMMADASDQQRDDGSQNQPSENTADSEIRLKLSSDAVNQATAANKTDEEKSDEEKIGRKNDGTSDGDHKNQRLAGNDAADDQDGSTEQGAEQKEATDPTENGPAQPGHKTAVAANNENDAAADKSEKTVNDDVATADNRADGATSRTVARSDADRRAKDREDAERKMAEAMLRDADAGEPIEPADDPDSKNDVARSGGNNSGNANSDRTGNKRKDDQSDNPSRPRVARMRQQQSESGQRKESNRRRLRITDRLTAVAAAAPQRTERMDIKDRVQQIDRMLAQIEDGLVNVVEQNVADADRSEAFLRIDGQLGSVETYIAELRVETRDEQYVFVGLQMVDIKRTHVTPARDRVYVAIREPIAGANSNSTDALAHVVRARELLHELLNKVDDVEREERLASSIEKAAKIYEVLVEKTQRLLQERRQNKNPLSRRMAIVEVDQSYLDRYAEVINMRRELRAEFGRILTDDPRLLARYMDLVKRRNSSLRDQLTELFERQDEISMEVNGWLQVDNVQRENLWVQILGLRLLATDTLAADAGDFAERVEKQMPLILKTDQGSAALIIKHAQNIALQARAIAFQANRSGNATGIDLPPSDLSSSANELVYEFGELDAALDQLEFENESDEDVRQFVELRLLESRTLADQADSWSESAEHISHQRYHGLAEADQQKVAIATELLRVDMLDMDDRLQTSFRQQGGEDTLSAELLNLVREFHETMEGITFTQAAATFALSEDRIGDAALQQARSLAGFEHAEDLFDSIRRTTIEVLDELAVRNPAAADLRDPTLDEFLRRLE